MGEINPFHVWINPYPVAENDFRPLNFKIFCKASILIRGPEMVKMIPFPVWINPYPISKTGFDCLA